MYLFLYRLALLSAQIDELNQQLVLFVGNLLDRTIARLLQDTIDVCLLELRRDLGIAESLEYRLQSGEHALHEMFDTARSAANVVLQVRAHDSPPQPWTPAHGIVGLRGTDHALLDEIQNLLVERQLQTVRDVTWDFLAKMNRLLADGCIECHRLFDGLGRSFNAPDHF